MEETMTGFCMNKGATRGSRSSSSSSSSSSGTKCGRWNPTSEQVKVLTELVRSGLRTPSTDQIQKISSQLSFYGKIESKNVFYWFQNHKARERQKRRKVVSLDDNDEDIFLLKPDHEFTKTAAVFPSPKRTYAGIYRNNKHEVMYEPERVIETLQLFPLSSLGSDDSDSEKLRFHGTTKTKEYYCREKLSYGTLTFETAQMDHPPLDLRLSFL